jgi:acyl-coenzyme A synthetase/AMP-(fatty) acid ligase
MLQAAITALSAVGIVGLLFVSWLFARSLLPPATPLVLRFALSEDAATTLLPGARRYLWWLTLLWATLLLACACAIAVRLARGGDGPSTVVFAPLLLGALLFLGERALRGMVFGPQSVGSLIGQWRIASSILRDEAAGCLQFLFTDTLPLFRLTDDSRRLLVWRTTDCSVGALRGAAHALAEALPVGQRVLVACDDRASFLWAVLACWVARRTVVLPPPDLSHLLSAAGQTYFDCVITDRSDFVVGAGYSVKRIDSTALMDALTRARPKNRIDVLRASHVAAIFFTSGSTGVPVAQTKTWRQLVETAAAMSDLLGMRDLNPLLGGTVVHSHMFGFEMLVLQALQGSASVYVSRIVYPSDMLAFAAIEASQKWLVTTPYHLGVFADAAQWTTGLRRIVSATMPLDFALAAAIEEATGAEVHEIYGSTEAGCIATRRTTAGDVWRPATDVRLSIDADGSACLHARRVGGILPLSDRIELRTNGFRLLCRDSDLVKVAGKRASLQGLTQVLRGIDGVKDGCFVDGTRIGQKRLAALVVAPGMSSKSVREALASMIDATFLPRPLLLVDELPRDANGKLRVDHVLWSVPRAIESPERAIVEARLSDAS